MLCLLALPIHFNIIGVFIYVFFCCFQHSCLTRNLILMRSVGILNSFPYIYLFFSPQITKKKFTLTLEELVVGASEGYSLVRFCAILVMIILFRCPVLLLLYHSLLQQPNEITTKFQWNFERPLAIDEESLSE